MYLSKFQNVFVQIEIFVQAEGVKDWEASEDVHVANNICFNCKLYIFVSIAKCIWLNCKMYLSQLQNAFVQDGKIYLSELQDKTFQTPLQAFTYDSWPGQPCPVHFSLTLPIYKTILFRLLFVIISKCICPKWQNKTFPTPLPAFTYVLWPGQPCHGHFSTFPPI